MDVVARQLQVGEKINSITWRFTQQARYIYPMLGQRRWLDVSCLLGRKLNFWFRGPLNFAISDLSCCLMNSIFFTLANESANRASAVGNILEDIFF